jgi:NADPH:quinone reductase-like Zn-dependent oxidoreductase
MRLAAEGVLPMPVSAMPLAQARRAHELLESRQVTGKLLLCP